MSETPMQTRAQPVIVDAREVVSSKPAGPAAHQLRHLELIQDVINRMASNSFLLKGWSITLVSALLGIGVQTSEPLFPLVAFLPALGFWDLDAYYLRQERLFRKLYDAVRRSEGERLASDPFSMDTRKYESEVESWGWTYWASAVLMIHGPVMCAVLIVLVILSVK